MKIRSLLLLFVWCFVAPCFAVSLTAVKTKISDHKLEVTMKFDQPVQPSVFSLPSPSRLVLDIPKGRWLVEGNPWSKKNAWFTKARHHDDAQKLRVVFDTTSDWKVTKTLSNNHHELILTFSPESQAKLSVELPKVKGSSSQRRFHTAQHGSQVHNLKPIVIVIDPGHGGKDPGAIGRGRKKEKDIVLAIAKQVASEINQTFGYRAELTRTGDYYIPLRERLTIARRNNADMFISIHADAYKNHKAHGASVFALSERGATSEAARWLAEKENSSELMGGVKLADKGSVLRSVLLDLSQTATTGAGLEIGAEVLSEMKRVTALHKGRVEQAAFVVLKSPDIPSLLVETGFVSNAAELKRLSSPSYQKKMAAAIAKGITQYFSRRPVRGSILEASLHGAVKHVVQSGDSLSRLSKKYNRSLQALKSANQLTTDRLQVGQVLLIPS